jgi:hypothetical protein
MWKFPIYILSRNQMEKFYNRAWGHGLQQGFRIGQALGQNRMVITGKPTKAEIEATEKEIEDFLKGGK